MMASIKTVLRKTPLSTGKFPVALRVTQNRKSKYFKSPFSSDITEWDEKTGRFNNKHKNYLSSNRLLGKIEDRAMEIITQLEMKNPPFKLVDFEKHFRIYSNPAAKNIIRFWQEIIDEMFSAGRIGNAEVNKDSKNSIQKFIGGNTDLSFEQITPEFLKKYEVYLRSRKGTDGGIGVKMRALRAVFNEAINRGYAQEKDYPFKVYKLSKLKGRGMKRALNLRDIRKIESLDIAKLPTLCNSKNFFLFSFYTRGMNFTDMMNLTWSKISNDRIHYTRSKTKGNFTVKIMPPVEKILNFYRESHPNLKYVFPILLKDNLTPVQINYRKHKCLRRFNSDLKEIAKICGITKPLTSYVARHSFANCLKQMGVSTDIISESMGHQDIKTTKAYLKELDTAVLDEANELLL